MAWGGGDGTACFSHDCPPAPWVPRNDPALTLTAFVDRLLNAGFPRNYYAISPTWPYDHYPMAELAQADWVHQPGEFPQWPQGPDAEGAVSCHDTYPYTANQWYCLMYSGGDHRRVLLDQLPTNALPFHYARIGVGFAVTDDEAHDGIWVVVVSEAP
jgi:hypothetical protein